MFGRSGLGPVATVRVQRFDSRARGIRIGRSRHAGRHARVCLERDDADRLRRFGPGGADRDRRLRFSHRIWGFRVVGSRVYVAADTFGLGILDISGTGVPRLAGSFTTLGQAKNVAVSETTALVADHLDGVVVLDVSTPSEPVQVGSGFVDGFATDVAISGPLMFASDRPMGLYVLDASEPAAPELTVVPQSTATGGDWYAQLELVHPEPGPPLVVLVTNDLLQLFDISDPRAPVQLSTYSPPGGARRAAFAGTLAYVASAAAPATGEAGMVVVDLSDPSSPRVVGTYKTEAPAFDVAVADSIVLLATPIEILILEQMP